MIECPKCGALFTRKYNMLRHQEHDKETCEEVEKRLQLKIELAKEEVRKEYEQRLTSIEEKNKTVIDSLIHAPIGVKNRQRVIDNNNASEKIRNFERVVNCTEIPAATLRKTVELMADGDILLFRRIFIDNVKPEQRCLRVKDFAREKFEYFDGTTWVTTTLTYIAEHFASRLHSKYKFLIFEKYRKVQEIDYIYHTPEQVEENMELVNELCWEYSNITEHVTKLGILDPEFINQIKRGIRGLLLDPNIKGLNQELAQLPVKKEKNTTVAEIPKEFNYDEEYASSSSEEEISPYASDNDTVNEDSQINENQKKYDDIILPSLFKVLGIKFNVLAN